MFLFRGNISNYIVCSWPHSRIYLVWVKLKERTGSKWGKHFRCSLCDSSCVPAHKVPPGSGYFLPIAALPPGPSLEASQTKWTLENPKWMYIFLCVNYRSPNGNSSLILMFSSLYLCWALLLHLQDLCLWETSMWLCKISVKNYMYISWFCDEI